MCSSDLYRDSAEKIGNILCVAFPSIHECDSVNQTIFALQQVQQRSLHICVLEGLFISFEFFICIDTLLNVR